MPSPPAFSAARCSAAAALRGKVADTVSSLCDFEKFYKTPSCHAADWAGCERFAADRDNIHQALHLCLMARSEKLCLPWCLMCAYHMPTYSFYVRISAGSTVSALTNGFSNPVVCWKFFKPTVLKPEPKMYLNTNMSLDSRLPRPTVVIVRLDWLERFPRQRAMRAKDIRGAQIMRCQTGQTGIVNYIYFNALWKPAKTLSGK